MCLDMLFFYRWSFFIQVIFVFKMTLAHGSSVENNSAKISFSKLLKNIVLVNEKRMEAIKKLAQLEDIDTRSRNKMHNGDILDTNSEELKADDDYVDFYNVKDSVARTKARTDEYSNAPKHYIVLVRKIRDTNNIRDVSDEIYAKNEINTNDALYSKETGNLNDKDVKDTLNKNYRRDLSDVIDMKDAIDANAIDTINSKDTSDATDSNIAEKNSILDNDALDTNFIADLNDVLDKNGTRNSNDVEDTNDVTNHDVRILRRAWHDTCNRKAAKVCAKACRKAHGRSCRTYKCSKKSKKLVKKECKILCKISFETDEKKYEE